MSRRAAFCVLAGVLIAAAQATLTVDQLVSFVTSSVQLKHSDRQVADYLKDVKLSNRLEERTIVELQAAGAGPRTVEALRALQKASSALPPPSVKAAAKPVPAEIPAPPPQDWKEVIQQATEHALNYSRQLPDFICTQVTRRYYDPSGLEFWQREDVLTARLSYFEQKEDYKLMLVNGRYTDMPYQMVGGAISSGEFGTMMREIFDKQTGATFNWERWATLRGRRMHVFSYTVSQPASKWTVSYENRDRITPGYHGLIYVDNENKSVARITLEADGIPASFPIQQVASTLDYDSATIGDRDYLLPLRAVMRMREGRELFKNEVEFRLYRKFSAEASISFETPEPLSEDKVSEQPPKP
jgi:hypothetical protein